MAAANHFTKSHLEVPEHWNLIVNAQYYYVTVCGSFFLGNRECRVDRLFPVYNISNFQGFHLTVCPPAIMKVAEHALQKNKCFVMNLSAPFICSLFKEPQLAAYGYVDILIGNDAVR